MGILRKLFCALLASCLLNVGTIWAQGQVRVLPGDHADPSVIRIGDEFWCSATTSNWFPAFPLLHSKDLIHWKQQGFVFDKMPEWADYYFWAPELSYENGKVYVYYAAHKKGGNLCVGVASADRPEGPYRDHGPLICQEVGSIDAFPMRDENGKLYLVWKEDANSVNKPTPIWAQELNEERTALTGPRKELFRNDVPWEQNLVEGVSMIRHGGYFYALYAASGCCGAACTYGVGVARSRSLLGPWEKYAKNPVITGSPQWTCPGHGTPIEKDGRFFFLYHGYNRQTNVFTGREGLLSEFRFTPDNWIEFLPGSPSQPAPVPENVFDRFDGKTLSDNWQWSVFHQPSWRLARGRLQLDAFPGNTGAFLGQKIQQGDYTATALVRADHSTAKGGVAAIGDENNLVYAAPENGKITVTMVRDGKLVPVLVQAQPFKLGEKIYLRMQVSGGRFLNFLWSSDGKDWKVLNPVAVDGAFLPPWDRAVRAGVIALGSSGQSAVFDHFELTYPPLKKQNN